MKLFGKQRYHHCRAAEERARAKASPNSDAKDVHERLARYHARTARDPDFVPFEKASRHGQASSYWAAAHLSNKVATEEEKNTKPIDPNILAEHKAIPNALGLRNGPAVKQLLTDLFPTVDDDTVSWPHR